MYETLFRKFIFPFNENVLHKRQTPQYFQEYEQNQWLSEDELRAIQWRKLTALLQHCQTHVPYYQKQWADLGMNWQDIKSLEDFSLLPILSKDDIRNNYDTLIADNFRGKSFSKATGGSTGVPLKFEFSKESVERRTAVAMRGYGWAGLPPGRKSLYLWGTDFGTGRAQQLKISLYHALHGRKMLDSFAMTEQNLPEYLAAINQHKPKMMVAFVAPLVTLAEYVIKNSLPCWSPHGIITGAEPLLDYQRQILSQAFNCPVFNTYGCREFMLIAAECDRHSGLHINIDHLHVEITEQGKNCAMGDSGNMTVTDLHNYAMPFLRYENGDMGRLTAAQCDCGRGLPLLASVDGRKLDMIHTADGRVLPGEFFPHLIKDFEGVIRFQVIQENLQHLNIKLITDAKFTEQKHKQLLGIIEQQVGAGMQVQMQQVDDIPLTSSGKFRVTICKLQDQ